MELLTKLAELHEDWIRMVRSFGETNCAEDLVQEMYLRIHKYGTMELTEEGEVCKPYVWFVLKNIHTDYHKQRKRIEKVSLGDEFQIQYTPPAEGYEEAFEEFTYRMNKEIKSWCSYDQKMFSLYVNSNMSMRDINKATEISLTSIFNTIKNCKDRLKMAVGEDFEDIIHGDYDKM